MCRVAVVLTVLVAIVWQAFALARLTTAPGAADDMAHALLHWHDISHHHHDDGDYHVDDSAESLAHVVADHLTVSAALPADAAAGIVPRAGCERTPLAARYVPDPFLDGLLRPPRPTA